MKTIENILLIAINAKYIHSNPAVYSLKAYLEAYGADYAQSVHLTEYTINQQVGEILADIYCKKPTVVAISCYIWNISYVYQLTKELHKILPKTDIWLGGPEVSFNGEELLEKHEEITGVMTGEGEETFLDLCRFYHGEKKLAQVDGIVYRDENGLPVTTNSRSLTQLTNIPFLYNDLEKFNNRIIYYESSRGCPFRCSYCLSSIDKTVRLRELSVVLDELAFFLDKKVKQVKFVDRTFNCNKKHALSIWKYLLEHDNGITNFHFEVAADLLGEEELQLLNSFRPGAVQLEIGVQSTNMETIREIDRVMDVDKLGKTVERIRQGENVHVHLDLIAGLPYEDLESFKKSFNDVYAMRPEQLQLGFLKVLKGSKMHQKSGEYGICYTSEPPFEVLFTNWITYDDVLLLKQVEEMVELYYNSNQFTKTLVRLEKEFASPFEMFEKMAFYFEKQGYFLETPARGYRYQILLEFACVVAPYKEALWKELLVMDVYLRENAKSRPGFAKSQEHYKEGSREFYRQEMERHEILEGYEQYDARQMARMTHIEEFCYDFETGEQLEQPKYVLFDYRHRNPLTYEARTMELQL